MKTNYLFDPQLNELVTVDLPAYFEKHSLQRIYTAENQVLQFDILSNTWQLGTKVKLYLKSMNELGISMQTWLALRVALADKAENLKFGTVRKLNDAINKIGVGWRDSLSFQAAYHSLRDADKQVLLRNFKALEKTSLTELLPLKKVFRSIIQFLATQKSPSSKRLKGIFDPEKGIYTDEEMLEIQDKLRLRVSNILGRLKKNIVPNTSDLIKLGDVIGVILLISIYRRPIQLAMMKWSDILPVGESFKIHRHTIHSPAPKEETGFSDMEQVHLRTFKAKRGFGFREYAEHRSHRLEPEFSKLIIIYRYFYKMLLVDSLAKSNIQLSEEELEDMLFRCPLLPSRDIFHKYFKKKQNLFSMLNHKSDTFHRTPSSLCIAFKRTSKKLALSSARITSFHISNNRSRHTVITNAIERGLSMEKVAAITGVTTCAVVDYIQLDLKGRVAIDEAMAGQRVLNQFARVSLNNLKKLDQFIVKNEFDEIQGSNRSDTLCLKCQSNICKPIGCYGCDNFRPFWNADHNANLTIIEQKISFNESSTPDKNTLKRLQISRLYCQATISIITEIQLKERGLSNVD